MTYYPRTQLFALEIPSSVTIDRDKQDADNQKNEVDSEHDIADNSIESFLAIKQPASKKCQGDFGQIDDHKEQNKPRVTALGTVKHDLFVFPMNIAYIVEYLLMLWPKNA